MFLAKGDPNDTNLDHDFEAELYLGWAWITGLASYSGTKK